MIARLLHSFLLMSAIPAAAAGGPSAERAPRPEVSDVQAERQVTHGPGARILTNVGVWSPDGQWIVYDTRGGPEGTAFDGSRIERVHVASGQIDLLYESRRGAHCGVVTHHPRDGRVVFILGPEDPTPDWTYGFAHRQGVLVDTAVPGVATNLDARDLTPPFTPGALRGGSHVHVWDAAGQWVSFTYEDHLCAQFTEPGPNHDLNQRNVGVSVCDHPVSVPSTHPRNHSGSAFTVLVTRTVPRPRPGTDDIQKACEEGWVGTNGYRRADGSWQRHALAFQGQVIGAKGQVVSEVFLVDLPEDLSQPGEGPLAGSATRMPSPPRGVAQRRLTFTADRPDPGIQGPRHWLRVSPDGSHIAFLMKDERGVAQLWTVSPNGGPPRQLSRNPWPIASAFTWTPDGQAIAHVMDNSVCLTSLATGVTTRLTVRTDDARAPRPEACVVSPDGRRIAFVRRLFEAGQAANQICVVSCP